MTPRLMHIALLLAAHMGMIAHAAQEPSTSAPPDRWYVMLVEGKPSGWMHESTAIDDKAVRSVTHTKLSLRRADAMIVIETRTTFVETPQGRPVSIEQATTMGRHETKQTITFNADDLTIRTQASGQTTQTTAPLPKEPWLPPAAAGRYILERIQRGEKQIEFFTLDPANDLNPFKVNMKLTGSMDIEVLGKTVPSLVAETTFSNLPGVTSQQHIDPQGRLLKMVMAPMPGFTITALLADKDLATAQVDPPELLASTLIKMAKPLHDARSLRSAVFELSLKPAPQDKQAAAVKLPDLPSTGFQRVVHGDDRTLRVAVDLDRPVSPGKDLPGKEHRNASAVLNSDDPKIKELVATALKGKPDDLSDLDKAQVLRAFVHRYIRKKDLSVGFAFASEVARTRQGDCTEHGVLLAAMLRAAGLPSRTASGLIYIDHFAGEKNVFGYHMWSQAWIRDEKHGGRWVDLDATLEAPGYDAAHITLSVSPMSDGSTNDMIALVPLIGRLDIQVITAKSDR